MTENISWILETIKKEFSQKFDTKALLEKIESDFSIVEALIEEIQLAIDEYNSNRDTFETNDYFRKLYINAVYLASIFHEPLPKYTEIIQELQSNQDLRVAVLAELTHSSYFKEVYELKNSMYIFHNVLILFYRTALLYMNTVLREEQAQLSSTIEEMACLLELEGTHTHLFSSTVHWIIDWENEGFSYQLSELIHHRCSLTSL